jgi:hypothetical protein
MISTAPTSKIAPHLARGTFGGTVAANVGRPEVMVLEVPNTSYQIYLVATAPVTVEKGKRLVGTIRAQARRVDIVQSGGRYLEPVTGRPRRIQGTVIATDPTANTITVNAGVPVVCALTDARQKATQFEVGAFVSFDALDGATFTPEA